MENFNPIADGANTLANSLEQSRQAGKNLTKSIENIQHDAVEVAQQELKAKKLKQLYEESIENSMLFKAIKEYEKQSSILKAEALAEKEFKNQYGSKEWSKVLELKTVVEKEVAENKKYYGHKLEDVRKVQFWCFFVAFIITTLLFYFNLV